jgi:hypothetical protein
MRQKVSAFSWGYWGWGAATQELVWAFDAVEKSRGHREPLFVDVRVSRSVRAAGFRERAFEELVGRRRYRWMQGLGNEAVATGQGEPRLRRPEDADELLGLILEHHRLSRRVVFFCSCKSPWDAERCHRKLVGTKLLAAARSREVNLWLEEWPGGAVSDRDVPAIRVPCGTLKSLASGGTWVTLEDRPQAELLRLPTGSLVSLDEAGSAEVRSVCPPRFVDGRWKLELFMKDEPGQSRGALQRGVHRKRADLLLDARRP